MRYKLVGLIGLGLLLLGWGGSALLGSPPTAPVSARPAPQEAAPAVCNPIFREDFESGTLGQFVANVGGIAYWRSQNSGHAGSCCAAVAWAGEICCAKPAPGRVVP